MPLDLPTSSPVERGVVACVVRGERFLIVRRSALVAAPFAYGFPGGGLEPGEDAATALVREMREELAVECTPKRCLWKSVAPWGVTLEWWLAALPESALISPNPREIASVHWLTQTEILALGDLLPTNREFFAAASRGEFFFTAPPV